MKRFDFSPLKILSACGVILTFMFGIFIIDDRYISAAELNQEKRKIYLKMNTDDYRESTKQYYEYKKLIKENPNDKDLQEGFDEIKIERSKLKDKIDLLLENGK
jgi:hypothetical protein